MFKSLTNITLAEYILRRKLTCSICDLISTNHKIIDIALDYGFDYEQNYIRSFKKVYQMTPSKARTHKSDIPIVEPLSIHDFIEVNDALIYKPSFIVKPAFNLVGVTHKLYYSENEALAATYAKDFFYRQKNIIPNIINVDHYYGYTYWDEGHEHYTYYVTAAHVSDVKEIPPNMTCVVVPLNKYAVFKLVGFFNPEDITGSDLDSIMDYMYGKWIYNSQYQMAGNYRFEFIDKSISKDHYCELYLYMPIARIDV